MTQAKPAHHRPSTMAELFTQSRDALKLRGIGQQLPSESNYLASAWTNRELLDSMFIESRLFDSVIADPFATIVGRK